MSHRLPVHSERQVHKKPPLTRFWQVPPLEQGLVAQGSTSVNKFIVVRKMGTDYSQLSSLAVSKHVTRQGCVEEQELHFLSFKYEKLKMQLLVDHLEAKLFKTYR